MEETQTQTQATSQNLSRLRNLYSLVEIPEMRESLAYFKLATNKSYFTADKEAAGLLQQSKHYRTSYNERSDRLMEAPIIEGEDKYLTDLSLDIVASTINSFLSDKFKAPDMNTISGATMYKNVSALLIQILVRGLSYLTDKIEVPEWIKPQYEEAIDLLNMGATNAFDNWINDLIETGNEGLVDYVNQLGSKIFGLDVTTKANRYYASIMKEARTEINNPRELYKKYLQRRNEYRLYTKGLQNQTFFDTFGITADEFRLAQLRIYDEFQLRFTEDANTQYLIRILNEN